MSKSNFNEDFKRDAVRQITEREYPVAVDSQRLGASRHSLCGWEQEVCGVSRQGHDEAEEIRRLKDELARVTEERDILKKRPVFRQGSKVKYAFTALRRLQFSARTMCRLLRVHPSGSYTSLKNPLSRRANDDKRLTNLLLKAWEESGKVSVMPIASHAALLLR